MKNTIFVLLALFLISSVCVKAYAIFILEPDKDYKMVTKEIINEDGTKTVVQEAEIIRSFVDNITMPEEILKKNPPVKKWSSAKGWERTLGLYKPTQPMFTVTIKKPNDWPISKKLLSNKTSEQDKKTEKPSSFSWLITALSLGIIAFATVRLFLHFREETDPNKI